MAIDAEGKNVTWQGKNPPNWKGTLDKEGSRRILVDPITRIEGHLRIEVEVSEGKVSDAWSSCTLFRGFEIILQGRDPRDAWHMAHRICGICPTSHGHAATMSVEASFGIKPPDNARLIRNMVESGQILYDHVLWFYHLNGFDYVDVVSALKAKTTSPTLKKTQKRLQDFVDSGQLGFLANAYWGHPEYKLPPELNLELVQHYLEALEAKSWATDAAAVFGGKFPYHMNTPPGGVTNVPTMDQILDYQAKMDRVRKFIDEVVLPDLFRIAPYYKYLAQTGAGHKNYLCWGVLDGKSQDPYDRLFPRGAIYAGALKHNKVEPTQVGEWVDHSFYKPESGGGINPFQGKTIPDYPVGQGTAALDTGSGKRPAGRYDWTKAVRIDHKPMEVGPLAQMLIAYVSPANELGSNKKAKALVDSALSALGAEGHPEVLLSNLGRIAARILKLKMAADEVPHWVNALVSNMKKGDMKFFDPKGHQVPDSGQGVGAWEAPRGALAHFNIIENKKIKLWQSVPASNWNFAPRDDKGVRGPVEEALIGTPVRDPERPLEVMRVMHTFDP